MRKANHKIENIFGPVGAFSGILVFIAGVILVFSSLSGLILIIIGAFVGFSFSSAIIDSDKKRIKFSYNIFGILPIGRWIDIESNMQLGIIKESTTWRTYSQSNRSIDADQKVLKIILYDQSKKALLPIQKFKTLEKAESQLNYLCLQLGLQHI